MIEKDKIADCTTCANMNCFIKKNYEQDAYEQIAANRFVIKCKKTHSFVLERAPVQGIYFVYAGSVKITKSGYNGKEQILRLASDGEVVGLRGYNQNKVYNIGCTTLEETTLCYFPNKFFTQELKTNNRLSYEFMLIYADQLEKSEERVKKFAQMTVREKVIDSLLYIYDNFNQNEEGLNLKLSRSDLANLAGTNSEQVIRVLMSLKETEVIKCEGKNIFISNLASLRTEIQYYNY